MIRSQRRRSLALWVTKKTVLLPLARARSSSTIRAAVSGSSPEVGSSSRQTWGLVSSSTATDARLRWPPLSCFTLRWATSVSPTWAKTTATVERICALLVPRASRSRAAYPSIRASGRSLGTMSSWGTKATPRRCWLVKRWAGDPPSVTEPVVGARLPANASRRVDLPDPLAPTSAISSPGWARSLIPSSRIVPPLAWTEIESTTTLPGAGVGVRSGFGCSVGASVMVIGLSRRSKCSGAGRLIDPDAVVMMQVSADRRIGAGHLFPAGLART